MAQLTMSTLQRRQSKWLEARVLRGVADARLLPAKRPDSSQYMVRLSGKPLSLCHRRSRNVMQPSCLQQTIF